ncbi:hypothetical protein MauCBS54593_000374 [Microsporum audouinii]
MAFRELYLATFNTSPNQSKHFAIFVPNENDRQKGTLIHVVGAPETGYGHVFERNYNPFTNKSLNTITLVGHIDAHHVVDPQTTQPSKDNTPRGDLEVVAHFIPPPSAWNFLAPKGGLVRRCQEWTWDFVTKLVAKRYITGQAQEIVSSHFDPLIYGLDPQAAGRGVHEVGAVGGRFGGGLQRGL